MKKCLIIGSCVCDVIVYIDHLPYTQEDIHPSNQIVRLGGCAYNVVHVLHHLDIPYTFISPVGKGIYGEFVLNELNKSKIKTNIRSDSDNGCCYCFIEANGERTFMSYHGAEYTFNQSWLDDLDLDEYEYLYVCGLEVEDVNGANLVDALDNFKNNIIFAPGPRGIHINPTLLQRMYDYHVWLHVNEIEAKELSGLDNIEEAAIELHKKTGNIVIITCGEKGTFYFNGQGHWVLTEPAKVKDTLGAGDSHVGALISSLAMDKSLDEAISFANKLSGKVVTISGPNLSFKEYDEFK